MASNRNSLRAGLFIVGAAILSLVVVILVTGPGLFEAKRDYTAEFAFDADMQGIKIGDDVRLAGIRVGSVQEVTILDGGDENEAATHPTTRPNVKVRLRIPKKYQLRQGATVSLNGGLVGGAVLNIDSIGTGPRLRDGGHLIGQPSSISRLFGLAPKLDAMISGLQDDTIPQLNKAVDEYALLAADARKNTLPKATAAAESARATLEDFRARLTGIIDKYHAVADSGIKAANNVGDFIGPGDGPASGDFKKTMANVKDLTATAKTELPILSEKIKKVLDETEARIVELKSQLSSLKETIDNTRDATAGARSLLVDNRGKIDRIISSLEATMSNAKNFSAEVLRRPSRLLWKDDEKTQENLAVYHSARDFAEGAQELNDAVARLRDMLKDPRVSDKEIQKRIDALGASFDRFGEVEGRLYQSIKP